MSFVERVLVQGADSPTIDAFGRLRVSTPQSLINFKNLTTTDRNIYNVSASGTATSAYLQSDARTRFSVTTTGDSIIYQTFERFVYQTGKSHLILMTGVCSQSTGVTKRLGYWDGTDGIFFQTSGTAETAISWNIWKNGTLTETASQSAWNIDKFDGTGPSGMTLDTTLNQIWWIDLEWLGVGRVRCGFVYRGIMYTAHEFRHSNETGFSSVFMSNPNLRIRYDITSNGSAGTLDAICATVQTEGGDKLDGLGRSCDTSGTTNTIANGSNQAILAVRWQSGKHRGTAFPVRISVCNTASATNPFRWALLLNPTTSTNLTAAAWTAITNSDLEFTANNNYTISNEGYKIASGYADGFTDRDLLDIDLRKIGSSIGGVSDILVLSVHCLGGNSQTFTASINILENI